MFGGFVKLPAADGPDPADDPAAPGLAARDQMQAWLDDPEVAEAEFEGMGGTTTLQDSVNQFICFDLNVHGWDLAHATGQDDTIDPEELPRLWQDVEGLGDMIRSWGPVAPRWRRRRTPPSRRSCSRTWGETPAPEPSTPTPEPRWKPLENGQTLIEPFIRTWSVVRLILRPDHSQPSRKVTR